MACCYICKNICFLRYIHPWNGETYYEDNPLTEEHFSFFVYTPLFGPCSHCDIGLAGPEGPLTDPTGWGSGPDSPGGIKIFAG